MKVVLVVPDAGPLISLAKADCLDVLLLLGFPIYVVDQVLSEVTRNRQFPDALRIEEFVRDHPDAVYEFSTAVGQAAAHRRAQGEVRQPGQGEAAIAEFLQRLDEVTGDADAPVLLLFEDSDILKNRFLIQENLHLVSTLGLLRGLEQKGVLSSAEDVWRRVVAAGRSLSPATVDRPGTMVEGPTRW